MANYYDKTNIDKKIDAIPKTDLTNYLTKTGDGSNLTAAFEEATTLDELTTGEKLSSILGKIKLAVKNIKSLIGLIGTTDISTIGDGTITGGLSDVNGKLSTATEAIVHDNITGIFTYTRIGYICVGCGTLTVTNDIGAYSAIVSNLPQTYTGNPYPGAFVAEDNTYNDFYINGSAIVNRKSVSKGHTLRLSCVYMCQ